MKTLPCQSGQQLGGIWNTFLPLSLFIGSFSLFSSLVPSPESGLVNSMAFYFFSRCPNLMTSVLDKTKAVAMS